MPWARHGHTNPPWKGGASREPQTRDPKPSITSVPRGQNPTAFDQKQNSPSPSSRRRAMSCARRGPRSAPPRLPGLLSAHHMRVERAGLPTTRNAWLDLLFGSPAPCRRHRRFHRAWPQTQRAPHAHPWLQHVLQYSHDLTACPSPVTVTVAFSSARGRPRCHPRVLCSQVAHHMCRRRLSPVPRSSISRRSPGWR